MPEGVAELLAEEPGSVLERRRLRAQAARLWAEHTPLGAELALATAEADHVEDARILAGHVSQAAQLYAYQARINTAWRLLTRDQRHTLLHSPLWRDEPSAAVDLTRDDAAQGQ